MLYGLGFRIRVIELGLVLKLGLRLAFLKDLCDNSEHHKLA